MMVNSELVPVSHKPRVHDSVSRRTVQTLAERLFRRNLAAQYCMEDHPFFAVEDRLIMDSVKDIRSQLQNVPVVHLTLAGIHLIVMEEASYLSKCDDVEDVTERDMDLTLQGVEEESLNLLAALAMPDSETG